VAKLLPVDTFDLIIFGGTGDLAMRKLLPALYHRARDGQITTQSRIIAVARGDMERDSYVASVEKALRANLRDGEFELQDWGVFASQIHYLSVDATDHSDWGALTRLLDGEEERVRVVYLATSPKLFGPVAAGFRANDLVTKMSRIVLEKPVGDNFESARAINDDVGKCFSENQIFRIDH